MAMDHPKISIITSVYKTGHYLPLTVQSILAQTFTDFELLLVDDGSPDDSGAVADELAKTDARIRVFHKENGGPASASNVGLTASTRTAARSWAALSPVRCAACAMRRSCF